MGSNPIRPANLKRIMPETFFTSDTHFSHANIIKYSNRPFVSADEMNETLIRNWNTVVNATDTVYHLGDFALNRRDAQHNTRNIRRRLNGNIFFIRGNHDKDIEQYRDCFGWIKDVAMVQCDNQAIFLSHYAHRVWPRSHRAAWHLYGHSHGSLPDDPNSLSFDCGVDCHAYQPISFDQVRRLMAKKEYKPIDHHGQQQDSSNGD